MAAKDDLGRRGEALAAEHLIRRGYVIVDQNWRCALGEIDIIAQVGAWTVFVEVKTRSSLAYGHPLEAITPTKLARLRRLAGEWCVQHPVEARLIRIDAIAVVAPRVGDPVIEHLERVF